MKRYNVAYKAPSLPGSQKPRWMNIGFATEQDSGNITVTLSGMPFPDIWKDQTLWLFPQDKAETPRKREEQRDFGEDRGSGFPRTPGDYDDFKGNGDRLPDDDDDLPF